MTTTTLAGIAGRIAGTTARGLLWANQQIDWTEVWAIVLHGLQILIVLTLLAGRWTRRAWDALPALSEQLGCWYAARIVPPIVVPAAPAMPAAVTAARPIATRRRAEELALLSSRELRELTGIRRKLAKRQLIELALAA